MIVATIDRILNRFTMYRVVLYGLVGFLCVSLLFAVLGVVGVSAWGLLLAAVILIVSCYVANRLLAYGLRVPTNSESWLITALILCCIMPPATTPARGLLLALAGILAIASKFVVVYRGSHIANPVAVAAVIMSVSGLLPATWWIATPALTPFTMLLAAIVLRKQRTMTMFAAFAGTVLILLAVLGVLQGQSVGATLRTALLSWPIFFFGGIMLTEPATLPPTRRYRLLFAVLVGSIFASQLHIGPVGSTPQVALLIGNLLAVCALPAQGVMARLQRIRKLSPHYYELVFGLPAGQRLTFAPGQYMEWTLPHAHTDSRGNRRTLSIASSPAENELRIAIRRAENGSSFKRALLDLKPGSLVRAAHVAGSFTLPADKQRPIVLIAGGIGITPYRSMVQHVLDTRQRRDISLLYLVTDARDFVYKDVFSAAAKKIGLRCEYRTDSLDAAQLQKLFPNLQYATVYVSGPDAMVSWYRRILRTAGVPAIHIKTDYFTGY